MRGSHLLVIKNLALSLTLASVLFYIKYVLKKKITYFWLLVAVSILPVVMIFRSGTYQAGDLTLHTAYLYSFYDNLKNGLFLPAWADFLCGGFGCPVFMFEYTMPFYIASFFHLIGFSFLTSMKLFLAGSYIASGMAMYYFVRDDLGDKSAFVASLIYLFAPVRFLEMHFRVSVGTDAVFIFVPLAFIFAKKALSGRPFYITLSALNILFLFLSHSSTALVVIPLSFAYAFLKTKNFRRLGFVILAYLLGFGISAWYVFPAIFEIKYTWYYIGVLNAEFEFLPIIYTVYSGTFLGFLYQGHHGENWPVLGYSTLFVVIADLYFSIKNKIFSAGKTINVLFLISFFMLYFMMTPLSRPLWLTIFFLRSFIVYWRVLVPIALISGYLAAVIVKNFSKQFIVLFCLFSVFSTILNWGNRDMLPFDQSSYFTQNVLYTEYYEPGNSVLLDRYKTRAPVTDVIVHQPPKPRLEILFGSGKVEELSRTPTKHRYQVRADTNLFLSENTYYFPGWTVYANGVKIPLMLENPERFGTLVFGLDKGSYEVIAEFEDTNIRNIGKLISVTSLCLLGLYMLVKSSLTKN